MYDRMEWLPGGRLNIAHEAIDRHANGRLRGRPALVWQGRDGDRETYTYGRLKELTNRFADVLKSLGVGRRDRVFTLMDRLPELHIALIGALKAGAIASPIPPDLGPVAVKERLRDCAVKVLVTEPHLRRAITGIIPELFELQHMVVVNKDARDPFPLEMADLGYDEEMDKASTNFDLEPTGQLDPALMHYTQSADGNALGIVHPHLAVVQHFATGKWVLDLRDDDVCWSTADVGRLTGTVLGAIAPWTNGVTQLSIAGELGPEVLYEAVQRYKVTVLSTGPETLAMLMGDDEHSPQDYDLSSLRHVISTGGPLSPQAAEWGEAAFGTPVLNAWGQAETGAPLIAPRPDGETPAGSIGQPVPGVEVGVLDDQYDPLPPGSGGHLAVRPGWPSMVSEYWGNPELYSDRFRKGWYITGENARMDENGNYWLTGPLDSAEGPLHLRDWFADPCYG